MLKIKSMKKFSIALYAVSILLLLFTAFAFISANSYIDEQIKNGLKASENLFAIINYYMVNCGTYLVYAIIIFGIGQLYNDFSLKQYAPLNEKVRFANENEMIEAYEIMDDNEIKDNSENDEEYEIKENEFEEWNKVDS